MAKIGFARLRSRCCRVLYHNQFSCLVPTYFYFFLFLSDSAGTISGEEMPIIAKTNIKEHRDSFSCEKFNFRVHHNITFYVYVSNFSWPIKIQVRSFSGRGEGGNVGRHDWQQNWVLSVSLIVRGKLRPSMWILLDRAVFSIFGFAVTQLSLLEKSVS